MRMSGKEELSMILFSNNGRLIIPLAALSSRETSSDTCDSGGQSLKNKDMGDREALANRQKQRVEIKPSDNRQTGRSH